MPEKRRYVRLPCNTPVEINWDSGKKKPLIALCIEVSAGGMRFETNQAIPVGTAVSLHSDAIDFDGAGHVRRSVRSGEKFHVGVEFTKETKASILAPDRD